MNTKTKTIESVTKERELKKKKTRKRSIIGGSFTAFVLLVYYLLIPYEGGITYGVCKVFLESQVRYPHLLRISTVDDFGNSVRIWYTQVDSFGEYRLEPIQCFYRHTTEEDMVKYGPTSFVVDKVTVNRREIDQDIVERFNTSIVSIVANPPDLTLPSPIPDSLKDMQIDLSKYRRPII